MKNERLERRSHGSTGALRATKRGNGGPKIGGLAIPVGQWSEDLGGFVEQIQPGAFTASIETDDIRALFNHDSNFVLGRKSNGTLRLSEDDRGISYEVDAPNTTWAKDLAESIKRGDIRENSFAMFVTDDIWEERDGTMRRTVRVAQLKEIGPQPFPAYPQSDVSVRSLTDVLAHGRRCVGAACTTRGQDPHVLSLELDLDQRGRETSGGSHSDVEQHERELDSYSTPLKPDPIPSQVTYRRLLANDGGKIKQTCIHEAGHGVANVLNGNGIKAVRLCWKATPGGSFEGVTWTFTGGGCSRRRGTETPGTLMAGLAAEQLAGCESDDWSDGDRVKSRRISKNWNSQDLQAAKALLQRHWPAVKALASALMQRQRLDGQEAEAIVMGALDERTRARLQSAA